MPLPPKLTKFTTTSPVVASFDFVDIAEGTGVVVFQGATNTTSAGTNYFLSRNSEFSSTISEIEQTAATYTFNFDLAPFNVTKTVKGTGYFTASLWQQNGADETHLAVQLQKWDGSSATNISSEIESFHLTGGAEHASILIPLSLTETYFQAGEILRLVVKLVKVGSAGNSEFTHDPAGRDGANLTSSTTAPTITTQLKVAVPFTIE